jgi:cell division protein FtsI/penicillin-binding protein 2
MGWEVTITSLNPATTAQQESWKEVWRKTEFTSLKRYDPNNIRRTRAKGISGMAWGQGELVATPGLGGAGLPQGIANKGIMQQNRYVKGISGVDEPLKKGQQIANEPEFARLLGGYMRKQSEPKLNRLGILVAGKTGTPERIYKGETINDGWYVFYAPNAGAAGHVVVCVRIENAKGSSEAVKLAGKHVIPILLQRGYIKGFESPHQKKTAPAERTVQLNAPVAANNP